MRHRSRRGLRRLLRVASVTGAVLLGACAGDSTCEPSPPTPDCADLDFRGDLYNEARVLEERVEVAMQELGNATYPDCNVPDGCPGSELDGFGATDVYLIDGVAISDAVIGRRQNSTTFVVFVRVGVDPDELPLPTR
jgi:hypothetical protein